MENISDLLRRGEKYKIYSISENAQLKCAFKVGNHYVIIAVLENNSKFIKSVADFRDGDTKERKKFLSEFQKIIDGKVKKKYIVTTEKKEAYREFLRIANQEEREMVDPDHPVWKALKLSPETPTHIRPNESFDLLKEWFENIFQITLKKFSENSMDKSPETELTHRQLIIGNEIQRTNEILTAKDLSQNIINANLTFLRWLEQQMNKLTPSFTMEMSKSLSWGNKTELCELINSLWQSKRILKNGTPIQQKELINLFETIFNADLKKYHDLFREGMDANKKTMDGKFFTQELFEYASKYSPKKKVRRQEK